MRRPEKELKDRETIDTLLKQTPVGRIATVNLKGIPVIKPVNFIYWNGKIYIHSSKEGEKVEDIRRGSRICFEVDEPIAYFPAEGHACKANYYYRSVILKGRAALVERKANKLKVLERMMEKYQPQGGYGPILNEVVEKTAIIEISIDEMTAKENLG